MKFFTITMYDEWSIKDIPPDQLTLKKRLYHALQVLINKVRAAVQSCFFDEWDFVANFNKFNLQNLRYARDSQLRQLHRVSPAAARRIISDCFNITKTGAEFKDQKTFLRFWNHLNPIGTDGELSLKDLPEEFQTCTFNDKECFASMSKHVGYIVDCLDNARTADQAIEWVGANLKDMRDLEKEIHERLDDEYDDNSDRIRHYLFREEEESNSPSVNAGIRLLREATIKAGISLLREDNLNEPIHQVIIQRCTSIDLTLANATYNFTGNYKYLSWCNAEARKKLCIGMTSFQLVEHLDFLNKHYEEYTGEEKYECETQILEEIYYRTEHPENYKSFFVNEFHKVQALCKRLNASAKLHITAKDKELREIVLKLLEVQVKIS